MGHHVPLQHGRGAEDLPTRGTRVVFFGVHLMDVLPVILQCGETHLAFLAVIRIFYVCFQAGHPREGGQRETIAQAAVSDMPLLHTSKMEAVQTSCGTRVPVSVTTIWLYSLLWGRQDSSKLLDSPHVQCQTAYLHHSLPVLYVKLPPPWVCFTGSIMLASPVCSDRSVCHFPVDLPNTPSCQWQ